MSHNFQPGDKVKVVRLPQDERFKEDHALYQLAIDSGVELTILDSVKVLNFRPEEGMVLTEPYVKVCYFTCLDCLELAPASWPQPSTVAQSDDTDKPYRKGMPDSEKQRIESRLAARRFLRGY